MKKYFILFWLVLNSTLVFGQFTSVTATITDSDSTVWSNAQIHIRFAPNPNFPNLDSYNINGVKLTSPTYVSYISQNITTNGSGALSVTLLDNNLISPNGSAWSIVVQSNTSAPATSYSPISVTGSSQNLTTFLSSNSIVPRFPAILQAFGYTDAEVTPIPNPGGFYWNTTNTVQRIWNGTAWQNGSGGGGGLPSGTGIVTVSSGVGGLLTAGAQGQAPVSNGAGTSFGLQTIIQSFGTSFDQTVQQEFDNSNFSTLRVNSFNKELYADGYAGYAGIGVSPIAWNSGLGNEPMCQVVTFSGTAYIAVEPVNTGITPGTANYIWAPIPNAIAGTPLDCAWYSGQAYKHQVHQNITTNLGSGTYNTGGLVDFVDGTSNDDLYAESLIGSGGEDPNIVYTGTAATPVINRPTGGANYASIQVRNVKIDGGGKASAIIEVGTLGQSYFENMTVGHIAPGSDHDIEFGHFGGDGFQIFATNINIGIFPDNGVVNCATITANLTGSTLTSFTVNNGGTCYSTYAAGVELTVVQVTGYRGGSHATPCTVPPTGMVATITGNALTAISAPTSGGTGCSGTIDVQVYQTPNVNYGMIFNNSDSTAKDIIAYQGSIAPFYVLGGNGTYIHLHPSVVPNGIVDAIGAGHYVGTECDAISNYCFQFLTPFTTEGTSIEGTNAFVGGGRLLPGSATYYFTTSTVATDPVNIGQSGPLCDGAPGNVPPTDWNEFVTQTGPIINPADYISKAPAGLSVLGNDTSCGQVMGDFSSLLTTNTFSLATLNATTANIGTANITTVGNIQPAGIATGGSNFNSQPLNFNSSFWNGSAPITSNWEFITALGTGTNPVNALEFFYNPGAGQTATPQIVFPSNVQFPNAATFLNVVTANGFAIPGAGAGSYVKADGTGFGTPTGAVSSVFTRTGAVVATSGDYTVSQVTGAAPLASPALTGTPTAPTQAISTNNTDIATTAAVTSALAAIPSTVSNSDNTLTISPTTGAVVASLNLGHSNTWTAAQTNSTAGALSASAQNFTGAPITGGSATTTFPLAYWNQGSAVSSFSTSGTELGINAPSGFAGNFIDLHLNGGATLFKVNSGGAITAASIALGSQGVTSPVYNSSTNCSSSASPAVCTSAAAGSVAMPTNVTSSSIQVNTTAVTANSQILLTADDTLGTKLSVTCNSTVATLVGGLAVTARTAGSNFTISNNVPITTNPLCISYLIIN